MLFLLVNNVDGSNLPLFFLRTAYWGYPLYSLFQWLLGHFRGLTDSVVGYRSIAPGFKPLPDFVRRVFHLSLRLITFGGLSAHLAYRVHKSDRKNINIWLAPANKPGIIIIIIIIICN